MEGSLKDSGNERQIMAFFYYSNPQTVPNREFEKAARTEASRWKTGNDSPLICEMIGVTSKDDFLKAWKELAEKANQNGTPLISISLYTHASKSMGDFGGLEFADESIKGSNYSINQKDILELPQMPWSTNASRYGGCCINLTGCNSGIPGSRGWNPAKLFVEKQKVPVYGEPGYCYFSNARSTYSEISDSDEYIYLRTYDCMRNNPDGNGSAVEPVRTGMFERQILAFIYYLNAKKDPSRAFERAARTHAFKMGNGSNNKLIYMLIPVTHKQDFLDGWQRLTDEAKLNNTPVVQISIYTHASLVSWDTGLEFADDDPTLDSEHTFDSKHTLTKDDILKLPKIFWSTDAAPYGGCRMWLQGCNTGVTLVRGWCPAQVFAERQNVPVYGEQAFAFFSQEYSTYKEIGDGDEFIFLHAYNRGRNNPMGNGSGINQVIFFPPTFSEELKQKMKMDSAENASHKNYTAETQGIASLLTTSMESSIIQKEQSPASNKSDNKQERSELRASK